MPGSPFGEWVAARYEMLWPELFEPEVVEPAVGYLARPARTGPHLELGIGTGRIVVPLSRLGVRVHRIDLSAAMVARLHAEHQACAPLWVIDGELKQFSTPHRYLWPSELDLMAWLAGMSLGERWSSVSRARFTSESRGHISVWQTATYALIIPAALVTSGEKARTYQALICALYMSI